MLTDPATCVTPSQPTASAADPTRVAPDPSPTATEASTAARWMGGAAVLASLSACGGGDEASDTADTAASDSPTPTVLATVTTSTKPASVTEAARFLTQATLGYTRADVTALMNLSGYEAWIAKQIALPRSQSHYDWMIAQGYGTNSGDYSGMDNSLWRKFIGGSDPLRQRVTLALSEICVASIAGVNLPWAQFAMARYMDLLEKNAFGNYRTLLEDISRSTAMAAYLTFINNTKANDLTGSQPDENYARELMQLFTIGLYKLNSDGTVKLTNGAPTETYTQADVSGLARVFTGWIADMSGLSVDSPPPDFHLRPLVQADWRYESGSKTFLGVTIPAGATANECLKIALDTVFNHANTGPFVCKQLIQRMVTSNPSAAYVGRVAAVFANNGKGIRGDMAAVVKAILLDTEARNMANVSSTTFGKLREPIVRFINWGRAFPATSTSGKWTIGDLSDVGGRLGQSPLRSSSVFNFFRPGYVPPGTSIASNKLVAPEFQITNEATVSGYVNFVQQFVAGTNIGDVRANYSSLLTLVADSAALLREINLLLAANQVSSTTLATLKTALDTIAITTTTGKNYRVQAAVMLIMACPEYIAQK